MSIERFGEYAAAFEQAYASDDWSVIRPYFTDDAIYDVPGGPPFGKLIEGLDNILSSFEFDVNSFDRKFDQRIVELVKPPYEEGDIVLAPWRAVYRKEGVPDLELSGVEQAHFKGEKIGRLVSDIDEIQGQKVLTWLSIHGSSVGLGE